MHCFDFGSSTIEVTKLVCPTGHQAVKLLHCLEFMASAPRVLQPIIDFLFHVQSHRQVLCFKRILFYIFHYPIFKRLELLICYLFCGSWRIIKITG